MENLALKIRLSVLWLLGLLAAVTGTMLELFEPGFIERIIAGEVRGVQITPELLLFFAIFILIPLVMAFLSLTLKDSLNRRANIILGIVSASFGAFDLTGYIGIGPYAYVILMRITSVVFNALVVWYAYKWKV